MRAETRRMQGSRQVGCVIDATSAEGDTASAKARVHRELTALN
jgi:hypothetical protein